jgi:hypothetical protein
MAQNQASDLNKADGKTRVRVVTEVRQTSQRTQMIRCYPGFRGARAPRC